MAITRLSLRQPAPQSRRLKAAFAATVAAALLTGCATPSLGLSDLQRITLPERLAPTTATVLMLGEQHDAPVHQQLQRLTVQQLSAQQRLGAVVLEMADRGHSTESLPADASESAVQQALNWRDNAVVGLGLLHMLWIVRADLKEWSIYACIGAGLLALRIPMVKSRIPRLYKKKSASAI